MAVTFSIRRSLGVTSAGLTACASLAGLELPVVVDGVDGSAVVSRAPDPCAPDLPAAKATTASPGRFERVTLAVERFDLPSRIEPDQARLCASSAVDLDGIDTCGDAATQSCRSKTEACDTVGGGDSALAKVAVLNLGFLSSEGSDLNARLAAGEGGLLLELTDYDGAEDDGDVAFAFIAAGGVAGVDGGGGGTPRFVDSEVWLAEAASFATSQRPRYVADQAYVVNDQLVARFRSHVTLSLSGTSVAIKTSELVVTGMLRRDGTRRVRGLDLGRLAARLPVSGIWDYAASRATAKFSVCRSDPTSVQFREALVRDVCGALDLPADPAATPDRPCDALSFSAGFYAARVSRSDLLVGEADSGAAAGCPPDAGWPPSCAGP